MSKEGTVERYEIGDRSYWIVQLPGDGTFQFERVAGKLAVWVWDGGIDATTAVGTVDIIDDRLAQ
jgi:hypothetical protein